MKRKDMIKESSIFDKVIQNGKTVSNNYFRVFYLDKEVPYPQFGLAVGKKLGNAVTRNYIKRQIRMMITNNKFLFSNRYYYIIMVKKTYLNIKYNVLEKEFIKLIEKVNK